MEITIGLVVSDAQRQKKYKSVIENLIKQTLDKPLFSFYKSSALLYDDYISNGKRLDIILLQASSDNFQTMNKIREVDRNCIIIYPAKSMDGVLSAFDSMPMAYVLPECELSGYTLSTSIMKAVRFLKSGKNHINFETKSKFLTYALYEIDYFESQYRLVHIVNRNGSIDTINRKLDGIENENQLSNFCRCHQSYLVNMDNIKYVDKTNKMVVMNSGQSVPSSKNLFKDFLNTYREYKGRLSDVR